MKCQKTACLKFFTEKELKKKKLRRFFSIFIADISRKRYNFSFISSYLQKVKIRWLKDWFRSHWLILWSSYLYDNASEWCIE